MSNRLGGAIIDSLYPDDEFMVLLSQETRFSQSELASFTRNANKKVSGFTMLKGLQRLIDGVLPGPMEVSRFWLIKGSTRLVGLLKLELRPRCWEHGLKIGSLPLFMRLHLLWERDLILQLKPASS
jgi:hypothetical protein